MRRNFAKYCCEQEHCEQEQKKQKIYTNDDKYEHTENEIINRELNMNDIFKLNLSTDENIWFMEHIRILKELQPNTLDRYQIKNMVYEKYSMLKKLNPVMREKIKNEDENNLCELILNSNHTDEIKLLLYKKYKRHHDNIKNSNLSDESFKIIEWIQTVIDLPTTVGVTSQLSPNDKLTKLWNHLNCKVTGLYGVKEKIMETMSVMMCNPNAKGKVIALVGPPGVGKTAIANTIAEAMELPFDHISFGSIKDPTILTGHSSTYIGATTGIFTKILLKSKRLDTVVLLDEIDKISQSAEGVSISSVLYHVLDKTQNSTFKDMYMPEIPIDLSRMIFILSANSLDTIDPLIVNRMTTIKLDGYKLEEKINIAYDHIFPKIRSATSFNNGDITIKKKELQYLIENKTDNSEGMRDVEKKIEKLCERILLKSLTDINFSYDCDQIKFPLVITKKIIDQLVC